MISRFTFAASALFATALFAAVVTITLFTATPAEAQLKCGQDYQLIQGQCVRKACGANTIRGVEGDCYCKPGYQKSGGKCVNSNVAKGYEAAPWKKSGCAGWKTQCNRGSAGACANYESKCQVN